MQWTALVKGNIYTAAVKSGDLILVAPLSTGADFYLTAFDSTGATRWTFKPQ
jgi:hypothetical protein